MTATADLSSADLDIRFIEGDDIVLTLRFSVDLTNFGGFEAQARPEPNASSSVAFSVDTSQQAARIITVSMAGADSAGLATGWTWSLLCTAPSRRTLVAGRIIVEQATTR